MDKYNLHRLAQNKCMDDLPQMGEIYITIWPITLNHAGIPLPKSQQDSSQEKIRNITVTIVLLHHGSNLL